MDPVGLQLHVLLSQDDRDGRGAVEDFRQRALMVGRQVLHQDEGHPAVGRQVREKCRESFQATRRGANTDDQLGRRRLLLIFAHRHFAPSHPTTILKPSLSHAVPMP